MAAEHLLLLPGMMCDARMWSDQIRDLDINCIVPKLTGSDDLGDIAAKILREAPDKFAVAGLSMGGIVAFELWRQAPERITHMALLDTTPFSDAPEKRTLRMTQIEQALDGRLRELAIESLKPLYLAEANRDNEEMLGVLLDMALDHGPEVFRQQSLALRDRRDNVELLCTIDVPTVVICGAEDSVCPVSYHEYMATRIREAELIIIDDCGHISTMEQPEVVTHALQNLLSHETTTGISHAEQLRSNSHDARR